MNSKEFDDWFIKWYPSARYRGRKTWIAHLYKRDIAWGDCPPSTSKDSENEAYRFRIRDEQYVNKRNSWRY